MFSNLQFENSKKFLFFNKFPFIISELVQLLRFERRLGLGTVEEMNFFSNLRFKNWKEIQFLKNFPISVSN